MQTKKMKSRKRDHMDRWMDDSGRFKALMGVKTKDYECDKHANGGN